jgi:hypothetical protein
MRTDNMIVIKRIATHDRLKLLLVLLRVAARDLPLVTRQAKSTKQK